MIKELNAHIEIKYIKNEFIAITNKIDDSWPYANKLKSLLHPNTSLDDVFSKTCIPVLLTYDSTTLAKYNSRSNEYIAEIEKEFKKLHQIFCKKIDSFKLTIHLFLLPLNTKKDLIRSLEEKLKTWQNL